MVRRSVFAVAGIVGLLVSAAPARADVAGKKSRGDEPAWLGIVMDSGSHGVLVTEVIPLSPAEAAGIEPGDQIFEIDGQSIGSYMQLKTIVQGHSVGDRVSLRVWRDGAKRTLHTQLARLLTAEELFFHRLANTPAPRLDATLAYGDASTDLDQYLGDIVLIGFWGGQLSRATAAWMNGLAVKYGDKGLAVVAVTNGNPRDVAKWADQHNLSFSILTDSDQKTHSAYRIGNEPQRDWVKPPAFVLVDRDGLVRFAGQLSSTKDCVAAIAKALEERNGISLE